MSGLILKYFVLKPRSKQYGDQYARASRLAMAAFASAIHAANPELSRELMDWVGREELHEEELHALQDQACPRERSPVEDHQRGYWEDCRDREDQG